MVILSGVGAREYYRSELGYHLQGDYMIKRLAPASEANPCPFQSASV